MSPFPAHSAGNFRPVVTIEKPDSARIVDPVANCEVLGQFLVIRFVAALLSLSLGEGPYYIGKIAALRLGSVQRRLVGALGRTPQKLSSERGKKCDRVLGGMG